MPEDMVLLHRYRGGGGLGGLLLVLALAGCNYASDYRPPADGRARPLYKGDKVVMVAPSELPRCLEAGPPPPSYQYAVPRNAGGYYLPRSHHTHVPVAVVVVAPGPPLVPVPVPVGHRHHHGLASGGGVDSGDAGKYMLAAMAVAALVAFPAVAIGLAMGNPEPEDEVAPAVDAVNRFNDEARERMAYCEAMAGPRGGAR